MPRPRNDELKRQILDTARESFRKVGYDATSYTIVAKQCGVSRNLVQYHFPKKQLLAIGFMERLLEEAQAALGLTDEEVDGNFANVFAIGTCYFVFLLQKDGYRKFLADVIRDRDLTDEILLFNAGWALAHSGGAGESPNVQSRVMRSVIVQMGGFYGLLHHCLKYDEPFDVASELRVVMEAFLSALGYSKAKISRLLPVGHPVEKEVKSVVRKINAVLL